MADDGQAIDGQNAPKKRKRRRSRRNKNAHKQPIQPVANAEASEKTEANTASKKRSRTNAQRSRYSQPQTYAALDLGTNNCRLLMATPTRSGNFRVTGSFSRIVRLGDGLEHTGKLSDEAMDRAIDALHICSDKLKRAKVKRMRLIATEACRRAENGEDFLSRVKNETKIDLEIVSREHEAQLAVAGCEALIDQNASGAVLFDIGGGSSEIALIDMRNQQGLETGKKRNPANHIVNWTSLPVGVVTLADRFGGKDVTQHSYDEMINFVLEMLKNFDGRTHFEDIQGTKKFHLLGTSGTVTTLAGIHLNLRRYMRKYVDGTWLADKEIESVVNQLLSMSFEERCANACIGPERADLVLAGCAILDAIRQVWPAPKLRVADRGLREGLLTQMMHEDNAWKQNTNSSNNRWRRRRDKTRQKQARTNEQ